MVFEMVVDEACYKEIAMVIAFMTSQFQRDTLNMARLFQMIGFELLIEKLIILTLIDKYRLSGRPGQHQFTGVPVRPFGTIISQITAESFLTPRAIHGIHNG